MKGEPEKKMMMMMIAMLLFLFLFPEDAAHGHVPGHVNCNHLIVSIPFFFFFLYFS